MTEQLLARMLSEGCSTLAEEDIERPILEVLAEHPDEARSLFCLPFGSFWILAFCFSICLGAEVNFLVAVY